MSADSRTDFGDAQVVPETSAHRNDKRYQNRSAATTTYIADQSQRSGLLLMKSAPVENW